MILNTTIGGDYESYNILEYGNGLALKSPGFSKKITVPLTAATVKSYEVFREEDNEVDLRLFFKDGKQTICMMDKNTFARFVAAVAEPEKDSAKKENPNFVLPEKEKSVKLAPLFGAGAIIAALLYYLYG